MLFSNRRKKNRGRSEEGFTLLEIMVAMAILGIGLVVVIQLFSANLRSGKLSREYTMAVLAAKSCMDELILKGNSLTKLKKGEMKLANGYESHWKVTPFEDEENLCRIEMQLIWDKKKSKKVEFSVLIPSPGKEQ